MSDASLLNDFNQEIVLINHEMQELDTIIGKLNHVKENMDPNRRIDEKISYYDTNIKMVDDINIPITLDDINWQIANHSRKMGELQDRLYKLYHTFHNTVLMEPPTTALNPFTIVKF